MNTVPVALNRHQSSGMGDELGSVVEADVHRRTALGGQTFEAPDHAVRVDGPFDVTGERLSRELVDDVQDI